MAGWAYTSHSYILKFKLDSPATPIWKIDHFDRVSIDNNFRCVYELPNGNIFVGGALDTMEAINKAEVNSLIRYSVIKPDGSLLSNSYYNYAGSATYCTQNIRHMSPTSGGGWVTAIHVNQNGTNPFFFVKYDSTGCDSTTAYCLNRTSIPESELLAGLSIYPNPTSDFVYLENDNFENTGNWSLTISDMYGKMYEDLPIISRTTQVNLREFSSGIYFFNLYKTGIFRKAIKIIKD